MRIRGFEQGDKFAVMRFELFRSNFCGGTLASLMPMPKMARSGRDKFQASGRWRQRSQAGDVGPVNPLRHDRPVRPGRFSGKIPVSVKRPPSPVWMRMSAVSQASDSVSGKLRGSVMLREEGVSAMYGVGICRGVVGIAQYAQSCEMPGGRIARIEPERQAGGRGAGADCGSGQSEGISAVGLDAPATFPCSGKTDTVVLGSVRPQDAEREYHAPGGHYRVAQGGKVHPQPVAQVSGLYVAAPRCGGCLFCLCRWTASYPFCDRVCRSRPVRMGIATCCLRIG